MCRYNRDGDLLFSVAKDKVISVWYTSNGERLGTYEGHQGAIWTIDVSPDSRILASGASDNTVKLWEIATGKCVKTWEYPTAIKRVEFSEDGKQLLAVTEKRMGFLGTIVVYDIRYGEDLSDQSDEHSIKITCEDAKPKVACWSFLDKYIISCHEDGTVVQWDAKTGDYNMSMEVHEFDTDIMDMQMSPDRTYFITSGKDKTSRLVSSGDLSVLKTYVADTPVNTATITPRKDFVILGGGQAAMDVTTTSARQGKFEARFYHKIFEDEIGRVKGHFGPLNSIAVHPKGISYASGGEDGYVRMHVFDKPYFDFMYEVEREHARK